MKSKKVLIAGAGGIGQAAGLILADSQYLDCEIILADRYLSTAEQAQNFVNEGASTTLASAIQMPSDGMSETLEKALQESDIILDCLPGSQAPRLAQYAKDYKLHYANLTEYVKETSEVEQIAKQADTGFILQTGLAPGYINVLAMHLFNKFTKTYGVEKVDEINMKVGALSKHARAPFFYAYTWSPIGVATEYIKDAYIVENYQTKTIPSLSNTETILID
ncbi:MAG: saccharopine dehydrogenase, partial [Saprospiraceae bacterium]|nr:saccharopine dehydrogenase [Saprospiraceae bacterium]